MLFFLAATFNAIVISFLMSLAAAGGFLALFFACITAIYIGALSVAVVVISTATISAIIAALITTGRPLPSCILLFVLHFDHLLFTFSSPIATWFFLPQNHMSYNQIIPFLKFSNVVLETCGLEFLIHLPS